MKALVDRRALAALLSRARQPSFLQSHHAFSNVGRGRGRGRGAPASGYEQSNASDPPAQFGGLGRGAGIGADPGKLNARASEGFESENQKNLESFGSFSEQQSYVNNFGRNKSNAAVRTPPLEDPSAANRDFSERPEGSEFPVYGRQYRNQRNPSVDLEREYESFHGRQYRNERNPYVDARTDNVDYYGRPYQNEGISAVDGRISTEGHYGREYQYERGVSVDPRTSKEGYYGRPDQNERSISVDARTRKEEYYGRHYKNESRLAVDPRTSKEGYYGKQIHNELNLSDDLHGSEHQYGRYRTGDPRTVNERDYGRQYQDARYLPVDPRIAQEEYYGRQYQNQNERYPAGDRRIAHERDYGRQYDDARYLPVDWRISQEEYYGRQYQNERYPFLDPRISREEFHNRQLSNERHLTGNLRTPGEEYYGRRYQDERHPSVNLRAPNEEYYDRRYQNEQFPSRYPRTANERYYDMQYHERYPSVDPRTATEGYYGRQYQREQTSSIDSKRTDERFYDREYPSERNYASPRYDYSAYEQSGYPLSRRLGGFLPPDVEREQNVRGFVHSEESAWRQRTSVDPGQIQRGRAHPIGLTERVRGEAFESTSPVQPHVSQKHVSGPGSSPRVQDYPKSSEDYARDRNVRMQDISIGRFEASNYAPPPPQFSARDQNPPSSWEAHGPPRVRSPVVGIARGQVPVSGLIDVAARVPGHGLPQPNFRSGRGAAAGVPQEGFTGNIAEPGMRPRTGRFEDARVDPSYPKHQFPYMIPEAEVKEGEKLGKVFKNMPTSEQERAAESLSKKAMEAQTSGKASSFPPQESPQRKGPPLSPHLDATATVTATAVRVKSHAQEQVNRVSQVSRESAKQVSPKPSVPSSTIRSTEKLVSSESVGYMPHSDQPSRHLPSINIDTKPQTGKIEAGAYDSGAISGKPSQTPFPPLAQRSSAEVQVVGEELSAILEKTSQLTSPLFPQIPAESSYLASTTSRERVVGVPKVSVPLEKTESTPFQPFPEQGDKDSLQNTGMPSENARLAQQQSRPETEDFFQAVKPDSYPHQLKLEGLFSKPGFGRGKPIGKARAHDGLNLKLGETLKPLAIEPDTHVLAGMEQGRPDLPAQPTIAQQEPKQQQHLKLSKEEATHRALTILEEGIEKTLTEEQRERRRKKFSRSEFSGQFSRTQGAMSATQAAVSKKTKEQRVRLERRKDQAVKTGEAIAEDDAVDEELSPEQQEVMNVIHNTEDMIKNSLHGRFLVDFEPEYAMEDFGKNPDIEEKPFPSLEETLEQTKHLLMPLEGLTEEKEWQDAVQKVMSNAPHLEKLVEAYSGPARVTARQQNKELEAIAEGLPAYLAPEMKAFTERALVTLQNNPSWNLHQKKTMLNRIVSNFASM